MFTDRREAGKLLSRELTKYRNNCVVMAIPRGGVVLGAEIARELQAPLDLVIVRKLGHPSNPEYAVGAVTEFGERLNEFEVGMVEAKWLEEQKAAERKEIARRRQVYLGDRKTVDLTGKTIILVDDGIATGLTYLTAIDELRKRKPARIVAALPVMPAEFEETIRKAVDVVVCLNIDKDYLGAVGAYYMSFPQVTDEEVVELMK